jgi:bromodomain-containing factor 1
MLDLSKASTEAFDENRTLPSTKLDTTDAPVADGNPGGPTPTEDASTGLAPIAAYIPKDAPNLSHLTPPPDQPLGSGEASVDTEMQDIPADEPEPVVSVDKVTSVEAVQLKEEPLLADTKPEESLLNGVAKSTEPFPESDSNVEAAGDVKPAISSTESTQESAQSGLVRPREDDEDDEPAAKRAKVDEPQSTPNKVPVAPTPTPIPETQPGVKPVIESAPRTETAVQSTEKPVATDKPAPSVPSSEPRKQESIYPTSPMTAAQKGFLLDKLKNTKKTKHAICFLAPVDPVALKIPTYLDVIKQPMDLGTAETKLRNDQYTSVQAFADDLQLIVDNAAKFNGPEHPVTHAGNNMLAYTNKFMRFVPVPGQAFTTKTSKKYSPAPPKAAPPRREARPAPAPPAKERSNAGEAFALQSDGMPTIRRDSQIARPARAIKPPTKHEVTYPKPKRREHLLELKFSEHVLDQIRSPRYAQLNHVFLMPVDPVALNIPHYRQIIKKPMDLGTMTQKLKQGQYGKASELRADFDLMIDNCIHFNPPGNPVRDLGIQLRREFELLWRDKDKWERANKPRSERASSASGEESAGEESDEEEEPLDEAQATIRALSQKLAEMQNQLAGLGQGKVPKAKKAKEIAKASSKKKALSSAVSRPAKHVPAPKTKPKKQRPVTYEEKQEISSAVEKMDGPQIERLTQIITENCEKYRNMGDEMELEIDDLPDDVQRLLLKHVRGIFGNPNRGSSVRAPSPDDLAAADDDDFEPSARARGGGGGGDAKRKKHKPMGKKEQQDSINNLRNQLAAFKGGAQPAGSESPTNAAAHAGGDDDSSGDDSEESEEE